MTVEAMPARRDTVLDVIAATGQVEAMQAIELRPEVEGRVTAIHVREGAIVNRGAALFKIDDAELRAQVERAEAERDLARQSLARTRDLIAQKASSQSELERVEASARSAEAGLSLLQVRLQRTTVRARSRLAEPDGEPWRLVNTQCRLLTRSGGPSARVRPRRHAARLARGSEGPVPRPRCRAVIHRHRRLRRSGRPAPGRTSWGKPGPNPSR